jgi:hypothetical protein
MKGTTIAGAGNNNVTNYNLYYFSLGPTRSQTKCLPLWELGFGIFYKVDESFILLYVIKSFDNF